MGVGSGVGVAVGETVAVGVAGGVLTGPPEHAAVMRPMITVKPARIETATLDTQVLPESGFVVWLT